MQSENPLDKYAVALKLNDITRPLPLGRSGRFAKKIFYFLRADSENQCKAKITGKPFNRGTKKGLEVPCLLRFLWKVSLSNLTKKCAVFFMKYITFNS